MCSHPASDCPAVEQAHSHSASGHHAVHHDLPASTQQAMPDHISVSTPHRADLIPPHPPFTHYPPQYHRNPTKESSAPRRGLAGRATEQLAGRAGGSLALAGGPPPSRHGCQAPPALSTGTRVGWPSGRAGHGGPGGADAGRAFVGVPRSSASVRSPLSGADVQHHTCLSTRPLSGVRCPVWVSGRPDVRCPVSSVGVRCPWVSASTVSGREVVERWRWADSRMAGMAGVGLVACGVHGQFVVGPGRSLAVEPGAGRAGPAEGSAWTWPSSWAVVGSWLGRARGRPGLAGCAGGSPIGGEPGCAARQRLPCVVIV